MNIPLDGKSYQLLKTCVESTSYITVDQLAENLNISKRSVYYALSRINDFLIDKNCKTIEVERKLGIFIKEKVKREIMVLLNDTVDASVYTLSPMERVRFISCILIYGNELIFADNLCDKLNVSRNTVFNDLKVVESKLSRYDLSLEYNVKSGYKIKGNPINRRALFLYNFQMLLPLYNSRIIAFEDSPQVNMNYYLLKRVEETHNVKYVSGTLFSLSILLQSYMNAQEEISFDDLDAEEIQATKEFELVEQYFPMLIYNEKLYLTVHLLGARLQASPIFNKSEAYNREIYQLATDLLFEFERLSRISIKDDIGLLEALCLHLKTSMFRYKYGIILENPLTKDIVKNYSELFMLTKKACDYLQRSVGIPINDSEIAFLALHFGSFIKETTNREIRVLLVCPNGVATGKMLKYEIQKILPQARIVDILPSKDVSCVSATCDLVVSTVQVTSDVPTLVVSPILTNTDRLALMNYVTPMVLQGKKNRYNPQDIYETFEHFISKDKQEEFKHAVNQYFQTVEIASENQQTGLLSYLDVDKITFIEDLTWEEAIKSASVPLLKAKTVTMSYIEKMVDEIYTYGPYNFITKGVVLAHAKPIENKTKIDVSMAISKKGIVFDEKKTAYVILVLSVDSTDNHLNILRDILTIFGIQTNVDELKILKSDAAVLKFLKGKLAD